MAMRRVRNPQSGGLLSANRGFVAALVKLLDVACIAAAIFGVCAFTGVGWHDSYGLVVGAACGFFVFFAELLSVYRSWRGASVGQEAGLAVGAWVIAISSVLTVGLAVKTYEEPTRQILFLWALLTPALLVGWRITGRFSLRLARASGRNTRSVAFWGDEVETGYLHDTIGASPWMGYRVVGAFGQGGGSLGEPGRRGVETRRDLRRLLRLSRAGELDEVYVSSRSLIGPDAQELLASLADTSARVYVLPDLLTQRLIHAPRRYVGDMTAVGLFDTPLHGAGGSLKRFFDVVLSAGMLIVGAPLLAAIACAVKLTSAGPVLFRQRRYGVDGEEIVVLKFRTMTTCDDGQVVLQAKRDDPRVTPLGRWLRRTSLDELPQLVNVLRGEMSLVGPRPHAVAHNEYYRRRVPGYMLRHRVRPGITGLAQVRGHRGETDTLEKMERRVDSDLEYVANWSLWLDLKILLRTVRCVLSDSAAY
jgi:putative colanic acid biosynthesis UDP-glucose lipid carrier transferase